MAMSQFSYGALASYRQRGEPLPVDGGFDSEGRLTRDAAAIEASNRPLPIGYWKGSGLALLLDLMAATLSGGKATHQIPADPLRETGLSQVFLAIDPPASGQLADQVIGALQSADAGKGGRVRYPGEQTLKIRAENLRVGIPVDPAIWREVQGL
jgi:3-dehydro-L-gulonate 2-dehydrogenase